MTDVRTKLINAVRPIGNKRRAFILLGAFAWLFLSGVIGGAGVVAANYAPPGVSTTLAGLWLGVSIVGAIIVGGVSARMAADEPTSLLDRVLTTIAGYGDHGVRPSLLADRLNIDRTDLDRLLAILFDDGKIETHSNGEKQVLYRVTQ